jgi:hypothetical protein
MKDKPISPEPMDHRIEQAVREIVEYGTWPTMTYPRMDDVRGVIAAIISRHLSEWVKCSTDEENKRLREALNRIIGKCGPSPSGRFRRLDKLFGELHDIYTQAMYPEEYAKANLPAPPSASTQGESK